MTLALALPQTHNTKCQISNKTAIGKRDTYSSYQNLPLSQIPALPYMAEKKSAITSRYTEKTMIVYDTKELRNLFYIFLVLIVVGEFFEAPSFIMIDTALVQQLQDKCHEYGKTRMFGSLGYGLASFGVGAVLDTTAYAYCGKEETNYTVVLCFFVSFFVISIVFLSTFFTFS